MTQAQQQNHSGCQFCTDFLRAAPSFPYILHPPDQQGNRQHLKLPTRPSSPGSSPAKILYTEKPLSPLVFLPNKCRGPLLQTHSIGGVVTIDLKVLSLTTGQQKTLHFTPFNPHIIMLTLQERKLSIREVGKLAQVHKLILQESNPGRVDSKIQHYMLFLPSSKTGRKC